MTNRMKNKTKTILEQKRKALAELEAEQNRRDEEMKREMLVARDRVIENAQKLKFEERDATKTFNRAIKLSEVFKERAIQLKCNEEARNEKMKKDLMAVHEQKLQADQYRKEQKNERQKNNNRKTAEAKILLKELKDRENRKRDDLMKQHKSGKEEMRKVAEEIEHERQMKIAKARVTKDKLLKNIEDNRVLTTSKEEERCREDLEEDMVTTIMANTKKLLARMRRSRELELMENKQKALENIRTKISVWPVKDTGWADSDIKKTVEAEKQRYQNVQNNRKELANKQIEYVKIGKKLWEEEKAKRQRILDQEHSLETERQNREKKLLIEYAELSRRRQEKNSHEFCEQLNKQCNDKVPALLEDRQQDINRHQAFERQWQKEDKEFIAYAKKVTEEKKLKGNPIVPLNNVVKDYYKKNNLYMDKQNNVLKKLPKEPVYTSRII